MTFQAIFSFLLIDMFLIIILRSYKDVRNSGADDPIAVEIRKLVLSTFRIWRSMLLKFFYTLAPTRIAPEEYGPEGEFDISESGEMLLVPRKKLSDMTKEEYQRQVMMLTQALEALSGEIQYLSERLQDVNKTQRELLRIQSSLELELSIEHETKAAYNKKSAAHQLGSFVPNKLSEDAALVAGWRNSVGGPKLESVTSNLQC